MNRDEALALSDQSFKELAEALKNGKSEQLLAYLDMLSRFHQYSFCNCMLIYCQRPDATLVAGFERWKKLVKKGVIGIAILAPLLGRQSNANDASSAPAGEASDTKPTSPLPSPRCAREASCQLHNGSSLVSVYLHLRGDRTDQLQLVIGFSQQQYGAFEVIR